MSGGGARDSESTTDARRREGATGGKGTIGASGWRILLALLRIAPQGLASRAWGWLARRRLPGAAQRVVNRTFARVVGIDVGESEAPPESYPSLARLFVRRLRPGARSWPESPDVPGSPVDGVLGSFGELVDGILLQAKGIRYPVAELLGDPEKSGLFRSGVYFTIYLSPRHYHRVHAPLSSTLESACAIPGRLLPVNAAAVRSVAGLFPRNERLVTLHRVGHCREALVAVGAYNVGSISVDFDPGWQGDEPAGVTNRGRGVQARVYDPAIRVRRGAELMAFHFGSTVIVLFSRDDATIPRIRPGLREGMEMKVGMPLLAEPLEPRRDSAGGPVRGGSVDAGGPA